MFFRLFGRLRARLLLVLVQNIKSMQAKINLLFGLLILSVFTLNAQFHTLNIPQASPAVQESQKLGVTQITITYSSPALQGRDVWNDPNIIPQKGEPIAWRAGANMNTTIEFSTDVYIQGKALSAGIYGFHIIPQDDHYTLLFANNAQLWGSYYLDQDKDVALKVNVQAMDCAASEQLDYEFLDRTEDALTIGLEWGQKRIPFRLSVDLNKTVVASFRNELRGINTYRWEAWNDAATWCLDHDTNLEEALSWANRSIDGGYYGFAANKNINNLSTKIKLLNKLEQKEEALATIKEAMQINSTAYEANAFSMFLLQEQYYQAAFDYTESALKKHEDLWFLQLNRGISQYFLGHKKAATTDVELALKTAPERFQKRLNEIITEIANNSYKLPKH